MTRRAKTDQIAAQQSKRGLASRGSSAFAYSAFIDGCSARVMAESPPSWRSWSKSRGKTIDLKLAFNAAAE
jgi:hypothetical protein